jgi:hypothetical protein
LGKCMKHIVSDMPVTITLQDLLLHLLEYGYPQHKCNDSKCCAVKLYKAYRQKYVSKRIVCYMDRVAEGTKLSLLPTCKYWDMNCKEKCLKRSE